MKKFLRTKEDVNERKTGIEQRKQFQQSHNTLIDQKLELPEFSLSFYHFLGILFISLMSRDSNKGGNHKKSARTDLSLRRYDFFLGDWYI